MYLNIFKTIGQNVQLKNLMNELESKIVLTENRFSEAFKNSKIKQQEDLIYLLNGLYGFLNKQTKDKNYQFDFPILYIENLPYKKESSLLNNVKMLGNMFITKEMSKNILGKDINNLHVWNDKFWIKKKGYNIKKGKINNKEIEISKVIEQVEELNKKYTDTINFYHLLNKVVLNNIKNNEIKELFKITKNQEFNIILISFSHPETRIKLLDELNSNKELNDFKVNKNQVIEKINLIKELVDEWGTIDYGNNKDVIKIKEILDRLQIITIIEEIETYLFKNRLSEELDKKTELVSSIKIRKI